MSGDGDDGDGAPEGGGPARGASMRAAAAAPTRPPGRLLLSLLLLLPAVWAAADLAGSPAAAGHAHAQTGYGGFGDSPFERDYGDVKFLDAYFGTLDNKMEVDAGDNNVPFTVVFANVGTQDITGIRGQLLLPPLGFTASDGPGSLIFADNDANSLAGDIFHLTFYVNIGQNVQIQQYPGTAKVDYSRLRESGIRTAFADFEFKVTGDSVINARAVDPFLTSLRTNSAVIEISNTGTAPISGVDVVAVNVQTELASTSSSITNVENVVLQESNWDLGNVGPKSSRHITATIYVPESLRGETLRLPLSISYSNAHGDRNDISKIVDFYVKGLIDLGIFGVDVITLSDTQMIIGEIINEGNEDGLFGFVSVAPRGDSNIRPSTQFIDEIEVDAPVPFNIPVEFDGEPRYGQHDITVTVRYKDGIRDEIHFVHNATVSVDGPQPASGGGSGGVLGMGSADAAAAATTTTMITAAAPVAIPLVAAAAVVVAYLVRRRRRMRAAAAAAAGEPAF